MLRTMSKGFTLFELLIVIKMIVIIGLLVIIPSANFWCTDAGVEKQLKHAHEEINEVVSIERHVLGFSHVIVQTRFSTTVTYCLNSNILFNYTFTACQEE